MPLSEILSPFLALIRSPLATAPITSAALNALHTFFVCELISPNSPGIRLALAELSSTISHSKFESGTSAVEEAVIFRIISVIHACICGSVGRFLGDVEVCEMLETVLTTCCQIRLSGEFDDRSVVQLVDLVTQRYCGGAPSIRCKTLSVS
jgi:brefeldin A-resistance guanine nucleotide exchange factor 1